MASATLMQNTHYMVSAIIQHNCNTTSFRAQPAALLSSCHRTGGAVGRALPIMGPKHYCAPPLQRCEGASPQPKPIIKPFCSIFDHGKSTRPLDSIDSSTSTESWSGGPQSGGSFLRCCPLSVGKKIQVGQCAT